jgi:G3E family GTPase
MKKVPIGIVSGFLGSGKTTLLNRVLTGDHGRRIAVLVNDFGEINIDAQLITQIEGQKISLANGCVCCTIRDDLVQAVVELIHEAPRPDYILIETSGISDPAAAAMGITMSTELGPLARIDAIVTIVDAENASRLPADHKALAIDQIEAANILLINKTDLVSEQAVEATRAWIREISPRARIIETTNCELPITLLFDLDGLDARRETAPPGGERSREHTHHHTDFTSWSRTIGKPLAFRRVYEFFKTMPLSIFRAKGILHLLEVPDKRVILQMVGERVTLSKGQPWNETPPRSQIVAIGIAGKFDGRELSKRIAACVADGGREPPEENRLADAVIEILRRP